MEETERKVEGDIQERRKEPPKYAPIPRAPLRLASVSERGLGNKGPVLTTRLGEGASLPTTAARANIRATSIASNRVGTPTVDTGRGMYNTGTMYSGTGNVDQTPQATREEERWERLVYSQTVVMDSLTKLANATASQRTATIIDTRLMFDGTNARE